MVEKQGLDLTSVKSSKAEHVGQVKPLEADVDNVAEDFSRATLGVRCNKALMLSLGGLSG